MTDPKEIWALFKKDASGLVPCIVQDADNGDVLMMAWMDEAGFLKTLESGIMTYYSRSRQKMWVKGETSGPASMILSGCGDRRAP